jgi:hypothetical protein
MDPQHRPQRFGRPATLGAGHGVVMYDQLNQRLPWHNRFRLSQETLEPGPLFGRGLLVVVESELLAAHEDCLQMRSQSYIQAGSRGFPGSH